MIQVGTWMAGVLIAPFAMGSCGDTDPADYDRNLDREVSSRQVGAAPLGTSRTVVERRLGGRGGRVNPPKDSPEPKGLDCFYYTELGGTTYYHLCYRGVRLADKAQVAFNESPEPP